MDGSVWSQLCNSSISRSVQELKQSSVAANSSAVSAYCLAAVTSGLCFVLEYRLLLWRRSGKEVVGDRIWKHLGLYSGWMCAGCISGILAFASWMQSRIHRYEAIDPGLVQRLKYVKNAAVSRYSAAVNVFYPVQLLCVIFAMNMLLRRVSDHASHKYYNAARDQEIGRMTGVRKCDWRDCIGQYALFNLVRSMHLIAMLLCGLNVGARVLAAAFGAETAEYWEQAAAACDIEGKDTDASRSIYDSRVLESTEKVDKSLGVSRVLEAALLLLMVFGFALFFPVCIIMFRRVEHRLDSIMREMDHRPDHGQVFLPFEFSPSESDEIEPHRVQQEMQAGEARKFLGGIKSSAAAQRRQFILCLIIVTSALLVLTLHALFLAAVLLPAKFNPACHVCGPCQTVEYMALIWSVYTPEMWPILASLCSTLPLLFSLWLMTTKEDRQLLLHPHRFLTDAVASQPAASVDEAKSRAERIRMGINLE